MSIHLGIDNGISGAIGIIKNGNAAWHPMPIKKQLNYTKAKKWINRVDGEALKAILGPFAVDVGPFFALIERPMVNPGRFQATMSAIRCLEATLVVLEFLEIPYQYIDSKEWQKTQLPSGLEGPELKEASIQIARRLWPTLQLPKGKDGDALLIARHCQLKYP